MPSLLSKIDESKIEYPKLSIIVLGKDSERHVERLFQSLTRLDYPDYELIFVDGGSTDRTLQILQNHAVHIVHAPGTKIAEARNRGIQSSKGAFIAFTDHDCEVDPQWAKLLAHHILSTPLAGGAGGPNCIVGDGTAKSEAISYVLGSWLGSAGSAQFFKYDNARAVPAVSACNMMFRREVLEAAGLFDRELLYCEDGELCHRVIKLGYKVLFVPTSMVYHHVGLNSFKKMWTYFFSWGLGRTFEARKKKYLFSKTSLALLLGASTLLGVGIMGLFYQPLVLIFATALGGYMFLLLLTSLRLRKKSKNAVKLRHVLFAYLVEHVAYTLGLFFGLLARRPAAHKLHDAQYATRDPVSGIE